MNALEKVEKYLREHKKPVSVNTIACHYLVRTSTVQKALNELKAQGRAASQPAPRPKGTKQSYLWRFVAVPKAAPATPRRPAPVIQSYPHVRGYDD